MKKYLILAIFTSVFFQTLCEMACLDDSCCDLPKEAFLNKYHSFNSANPIEEDFYKEELEDLINCKCLVELNKVKECLNQNEHNCYEVLNQYRACKAQELTKLNLHPLQKGKSVNCCVKCSCQRPAKEVFPDLNLKDPDYLIKVASWRNAQEGGCLAHEKDRGCIYQWGPCS